jgi:Cu-Zn family superoxide dismutase
MVTKLTALGALLIALLLLLLVLMISAVSPAAPPTTTTTTEDETDATTARTRDGADARAILKDEDGNVVGVVRFDVLRGGRRVEVEAEVNNVEPPNQFHGFHVHTTGQCDPNAVDPATGATVPFFSAGGHFNPTNTVHGQHAGDFPVLLVMAGGRAEARFETDRFKLSQLFDEDGSAVIVHGGMDNYANIPDRYHSDLNPPSVSGPDSMTTATGDAGPRFACGVVVRRT